MGVHRTCGACPPDEIKKNTHPENITALFRARYEGFLPSVEGGRGRTLFVLDDDSTLPLGLTADPLTGQVSLLEP